MILEELKRARLKKGISLKELAEQAGTSYSALSEIENGKRSPTLAVLQRLAEALDKRIVLE